MINVRYRVYCGIARFELLLHTTCLQQQCFISFLVKHVLSNMCVTELQEAERVLTSDAGESSRSGYLPYSLIVVVR